MFGAAPQLRRVEVECLGAADCSILWEWRLGAHSDRKRQQQVVGCRVSRWRTLAIQWSGRIGVAVVLRHGRWGLRTRGARRLGRCTLAVGLGRGRERSCTEALSPLQKGLAHRETSKTVLSIVERING
jgi:hypothetical protein